MTRCRKIRKISVTKSCHQDIQTAINGVILATDFEPPVPCLDKETWNKTMDRTNGNKARNHTLEWVGDSLMAAAISLELYRQVPNGNPCVFAVVRARLVTNETFALLMHKLNNIKAVCDQTRISHLDPSFKKTADLFEVIAANICIYSDFETLTAWVGRLFQPLIKVAIKTYFGSLSRCLGKRKREGDENNHQPEAVSHSTAESSRSINTRAGNQLDVPQAVASASAAESSRSVPVEAEIKAKDRQVVASTSIAEAAAMQSTPTRPRKRRKITRDTPDIYIIGSGLSDPSSSLPATQGISDTGRSPPAAPIAEPRHTQDMEPAEITTTQMMHGPGSSRSNPIFIDSDLEDTFEHPYSTRTIPSPPSTRIWRIPSNTRVLHGPIPSPPSTRNRRAPAS